MALYRGTVIRNAGQDWSETVVVTGLCCQVPFQVAQLNMAWVDLEYADDLFNSGSKVRVSVQSRAGHQGLDSVSLLAIRSVTSYVDLFADAAQVVLPVQSTTGNIIVRIETSNVPSSVKASFAIDLSFITLKELDYMRLVASGY